MPIAVDSFLRERGFSAHPFATTNAERETEVLPSFFVPGEAFEWLVGDPARPQSLILFAPQGFGKTSYRVELARQVSQRREHTALVVTLDDFTPLVRNELEKITLDSHITLIRRLTLEALDTQIERSTVRRAQFQREPTARALLFGLLQLYAPRRVIGRGVPPEAEAFGRALQAEAPGPREVLRDLVSLAHSAGFSSIYCLFDGLDELHELRDNADNMFRLLSPLLDAPGLLDECAFAFRFFIPHAVADEMKRLGIGRLDRIPNRVLSWSEEQLLEMLARRLQSFSRSSEASSFSRVTAFRDLCAASFDVDRVLVRAAGSSPRRLIDLARTIIEEHCLSVNSPDVLITAQTVAAVSNQPLPNPYSSTSPGALLTVTSPENGSAPASPVPTINPAHSRPAVPLLYVDDKSEIWLGERRLDVNLGGLMRRCLEYLWQQRHRRITYDELIEALYGKDLHQRGDPHGSMEKLVKRLRETLEPKGGSSHTYVKTQPGIGYVLQNYRDAHQHGGDNY